MTEPRRLFEDADGLELALLRAGMDDAPSEASRKAVAAALGLGTAAAGLHAAVGSGTVKGLTALGTKGLLAITAAVTIASGTVGAVVVWHNARSAHRTPPARSSTAHVKAPPHEVQPLPSSPCPSAPPSAPEAPAKPQQVLRAPIPEVHAPKAEPSAQMREELRLIGEAHAAVRRGDLQLARGELATYRRRFASGRLRPEAMALQVELERRAGDAAAAREWAHTFVDQYPHHPLRARVEQLVEKPEE